MKTLKHIPRHQAVVVKIAPKMILKKDAMAYVGMKRTAFDEMVSKHGLSMYAYGRNKIWYKVSELDELIESFCIKKQCSNRYDTNN